MHQLGHRVQQEEVRNLQRIQVDTEVARIKSPFNETLFSQLEYLIYRNLSFGLVEARSTSFISCWTELHTREDRLLSRHWELFIIVQLSQKGNESSSVYKQPVTRSAEHHLQEHKRKTFQSLPLFGRILPYLVTIHPAIVKIHFTVFVFHIVL